MTHSLLLTQFENSDLDACQVLGKGEGDRPARLEMLRLGPRFPALAAHGNPLKPDCRCTAPGPLHAQLCYAPVCGAANMSDVTHTSVYTYTQIQRRVENHYFQEYVTAGQGTQAAGAELDRGTS